MGVIQTLIPLGLRAALDLLQAEGTQLAGPRYRRTGGHPDYARWGRQPGSVRDQRQTVEVRTPTRASSA